MTQIRFVLELIFLFISLILLLFGMQFQTALGLGLMLGSVVLPFFIFELFFYNRQQRNILTGEILLNEYIRSRIGFDPKNQELRDANNITEEDIRYITEWYKDHQREMDLRTKFWTKEFLDRIPPIGMSWASGYTPILDNFSHNEKSELIDLDEHFFFSLYKKEIELAEHILAQSGRNNVLVVGEEGVGKRFILKGLERLIETGRALPALSFKRFIWLDAEALLSGIENGGELRKRLEEVFQEALRAGNIVLGIERFHSLLDPLLPEIPDILIPFLQSEYSQVIATTTPQFLASRVQRQDLASQFGKITLQEPTIEQTALTLQEFVWHLEQKEKMFIPYQSMKKIVELADRFSVDIPRPQKDIDFLQEALSFAKGKGKPQLEVPDILEVFSQRTGIPLGVVGEEEKEKLLHLEDLLHQRLVDQKEAVQAISRSLKRARVSVRETRRPIGSFLFLGPTGVGKTTAAKVLAQLYFGQEEAMVRFDMSEYQQLQDIERLIDLMAQEVRQKPYSLLLVDEIEKSHEKILHLFLQILDEGILTDTKGIKVDFRNLIIIATSNAGSEFIRNNISRVGTKEFEQDLLNGLQEKGIFTPEFLNRFDSVVTFKPLEPKELEQIALLLLNDLADRVKKEHNIDLVLTPELQTFLATKGFDPQYGARPMRRVLQDAIETTIANKILTGEIKRGQSLTLNPSDLPA